MKLTRYVCSIHATTTKITLFSKGACTTNLISQRLLQHRPGACLLPNDNLSRTTRCHSTSRQETDIWKKPTGQETGISVVNSATRAKVPLILPVEGNLKWYVCGPTVYDDPHIGHACSYTRFDIIRRILTNVFNINVVYMMNITNIDDKIIAKANQAGQTTDHLSIHYESRFLQSMARLNILKPTVISRVTDNIPCIIRFIQRLIENDSAYGTAQGNVYFRCSSSPQYGSLSKVKVISPEETSAADDKRNPKDFAMWKACKPGEPWWESPWGRGRPGWHVECSAMASEVFGDNIDIHSGGHDLMFPHHENELAQSNCYHQTDQWVNYWLHSGLLRTTNDSEKMSKSLGNVISVDELLRKYTANQFRMFCLLSPYSNEIEFSDDNMKKAIKIHKKLAALKSLAESYIEGTSSTAANSNVDDLLLSRSLTLTQNIVRTALANDFDSPRSMAALMNLVHVCNIELCKKYPKGVTKARSVSSVAAIATYLDTMMSHLGVSLSPHTLQSSGSADDSRRFTQVVNSVTSFREKVRNFSLGGIAFGADAEEKARIKAHRKEHSVLLDSCDQIRGELSTLAGIEITDTNEGKSCWTLSEDVDGERE